jgi:hypothetical protein
MTSIYPPRTCLMRRYLGRGKRGLSSPYPFGRCAFDLCRASMPALKNPIRWLPSENPDNPKAPRAAVVSVVPMSKALVKRWVTDIQPLVDEHYHFWIDADNADTTRADVGWNWKNIWLGAIGFSLISHVPRVKSGRVRAMCIVVEQNGEQFPIGMLTAVPKLNSQVDEWGLRGFAWYLADAPLEAYREVLKRPYIFGVAKALLDCAVQATVDGDGSGELLLHAASEGGDKLINFYETKCSMTKLEKCDKVVTKFRSYPRNEFFHWTADDALGFCIKNDNKRASISTQASASI